MAAMFDDAMTASGQGDDRRVRQRFFFPFFAEAEHTWARRRVKHRASVGQTAANDGSK